MTPNASHTEDRRRVGSATHAINNKAIVSRSTSTFVDRMPMLVVGVLRPEPTLRRGAVRAFYHPNELLAKLCLLPGPQAALIAWDIREYRLSAHACPCHLVCTMVQLAGLFRWCHLMVDLVTLPSLLSMRTNFQTSPQNAITNFWRASQADVPERLKTSHPLLDIHCCCWD